MVEGGEGGRGGGREGGVKGGREGGREGGRGGGRERGVEGGREGGRVEEGRERCFYLWHVSIMVCYVWYVDSVHCRT